MSDTIVDMAKVTQMLDSGWHVRIGRHSLGGYAAEARHPNPDLIDRANRRLILSCPAETRAFQRRDCRRSKIVTDDLTPEQALTRLAYKVHGEVI